MISQDMLNEFLQNLLWGIVPQSKGGVTPHILPEILTGFFRKPEVILGIVLSGIVPKYI